MRRAGFSLGWIFRVTLAAVIGILFLKWALNKVNIPGLSRAINAV